MATNCCKHGIGMCWCFGFFNLTFSKQWISGSHGRFFHFENWAEAVDSSDLKSAPRSEGLHEKLKVSSYNYVHRDLCLHIKCLYFLPADLKRFSTDLSWTVYWLRGQHQLATILFLLVQAYLLLVIKRCL